MESKAFPGAQHRLMLAGSRVGFVRSRRPSTARIPAVFGSLPVRNRQKSDCLVMVRKFNLAALSTTQTSMEGNQNRMSCGAAPTSLISNPSIIVCPHPLPVLSANAIWTEIGNRIMSERYPTPMPAPSTPPRAYPVARPVTAAAASMEASTETPSAVKPGLRFNRPAEPDTSRPESRLPVRQCPPPVNRPSVPVASVPRKTVKSGEPNFRMAVGEL